jgi:hypothetical protein
VASAIAAVSFLIARPNLTESGTMKKIDWSEFGAGIFGFVVFILITPTAIILILTISNRDLISQVGLINTLKSCTIKGNIDDDGERIYHLQGREYYKQTVIEPGRGEKVYCTEEEAQNAGFRKSEADYTKEHLEEVEQNRQAEESDRCGGSAGSTRGC